MATDPALTDRHYLGIDIGTSGCRSCLIDADAQTLAEVRTSLLQEAEASSSSGVQRVTQVLAKIALIHTTYFQSLNVRNTIVDALLGTGAEGVLLGQLGEILSGQRSLPDLEDLVLVSRYDLAQGKLVVHHPVVLGDFLISGQANGPLTWLVFAKVE